MKAIEIKSLCKNYKTFALNDVSFSLEMGYIMGFVGRNGAGKSTTLKSMMNLVHADSGDVEICEMNVKTHEREIKQLVGFVNGGMEQYSTVKIKTITDVTRRFYEEWDDAKYHELLERFEIDEKKKFKQLSTGMKLKYSIAVALSHNAKVLILDEPTSGLDPAARDEIVQIFQEFVEDGEHAILFSTHITSDLDKCADYITYIKNGEILSSSDRQSFIDGYKCVSGSKEDLTSEREGKVIGIHKHSLGFEGLIESKDADCFQGLNLTVPTLEDIMVHIERRK